MTATQGSNTWEGVIAAAKVAGAAFPELVAAQWALESGWGKHVSGRHNYFGLKGKGSKRTTQEVVNGKRITIEDSFLDFDSLEAAVAYLVDRWHKDWRGHKGVNNATTREAAAGELVSQGYATDPEYAKKLIKLMVDKTPKQAVAKEEASILTISAKTNTWLKKSVTNAILLDDKDKKAVHAGKDYAVIAYKELPANAHAEVKLSHGAGNWYIYEPHWSKIQLHDREQPAGVDWNDFNSLVTPNLTVGEVLQWDKRRTPGPNASVRTRLLKTADQYQLIRSAWGASLGVTSFYRPEPINQQVGGVPGSRHATGEAFDVYPLAGRSLDSFYQWIRQRWTGGLGDGRHRGFIHLDTRNGGHFVPGAGVRPAVEWTY